MWYAHGRSHGWVGVRERREERCSSLAEAGKASPPPGTDQVPDFSFLYKFDPGILESTEEDSPVAKAAFNCLLLETESASNRV